MSTPRRPDRAGLSALLHAAFCVLALAGALPAPAAAQEQAAAQAEAQTSQADDALPEGALPEGELAEGELAEGVDPALLPADLSPWGMFLAADIVVQAVMVGLALASVVTWTILQVKLVELARSRRKARSVAEALGEARSLADVAGRFGPQDGAAGALVAAAANELRLSHDAGDKEGVKERISLSFSRIEAAAARRMMRATGLLATIGATAPFVGLFGTVWGIMNSFIGISEAHTTNLAVVAPGIAEALLATALGLVAAVPAVVIYNVFARAIAGYKALLADASAEVMRLVSRDLDRGLRPLYSAAE
jgi:biopolymer transport protein ExbB